jgi:hypothetical protein
MKMPYPEFIKISDDFHAMRDSSFVRGASAIVFPRALIGDFSGVARRIAAQTEFDSDNFAEIHALEAMGMLQQIIESADSSGEEMVAAMTILRDMIWLDPLRNEMFLRIIRPGGYQNENIPIHDFHSDGNAEIRLERLMCCYTGRVTEFADRTQLYHDRMQEGVHFYKMFSFEKPHRFALGDIWRQVSVGFTDNPALIHRAPPSDVLRLMLIRDVKEKLQP